MTVSPHQFNGGVFKDDRDGRPVGWAACRKHRAWWGTLEKIESVDFFKDPPKDYKQVFPIEAEDTMEWPKELLKLTLRGFPLFCPPLASGEPDNKEKDNS
jgi:hypothetical protein